MSNAISSTEPAIPVRLRPRINWRAARSMLVSEGRLLARNPGVVIWTAVLPVAAAIILGSISAVRKPSAALGGLSFFQIYQPILVFFAITLLALQALPRRSDPLSGDGCAQATAHDADLTGTAAGRAADTHLVRVDRLYGADGGCTAARRRPVPAQSRCLPPHLLTGSVGDAWSGHGDCQPVSQRQSRRRFRIIVLQFFAGLWWQRPNMPMWLRDISNFTPSGAAVQGLTDSSIGHWPSARYLIVLAVWGVVTSRLAVRFFSWE